MDEDQRLLPVLTNINKQYMGNEYNSGGKGIAGKITADDVDSVGPCFLLTDIMKQRVG